VKKDMENRYAFRCFYGGKRKNGKINFAKVIYGSKPIPKELACQSAKQFAGIAKKYFLTVP